MDEQFLVSGEKLSEVVLVATHMETANDEPQLLNLDSHERKREAKNVEILMEKIDPQRIIETIVTTESNSTDTPKRFQFKDKSADLLHESESYDKSKTPKTHFYGYNYNALHRAGIYAPFIQSRIRQDRILSSIAPLPPRCIGGLRDQIQKGKQCACKSSKCLKLYCECFSDGVYCNSLCKCNDCKNKETNSEQRNEAILLTLERNPHAFRPREVTMAAAAAACKSQNGADIKTPPYSQDTDYTYQGHASPSIKTSGHSNRNMFQTSTVAPQTNLHENMIKPRGNSNFRIDENNYNTNPTQSSFKGCNCKKSFCLKKYCECFNAMIFCSPFHCRCKKCQNHRGSKEREAIMMKRLNEGETSGLPASRANENMGVSSQMNIMSGQSSNNTIRKYPQGIQSLFCLEDTKVNGLPNGAMDLLDMSLPPSSYTIPLQMGGIQISALSFGTTVLQKKCNHNNQYRHTQNDVLNNNISKRKRYLSGLFKPETDPERKWRDATNHIISLFDCLQGEIEMERKEQNYVNNRSISISNQKIINRKSGMDQKTLISNRDPKRIMKDITEHVHQIVKCIETDNTMQKHTNMDNYIERFRSQPARIHSVDEVESDLFCNEIMQEKKSGVILLDKHSSQTLCDLYAKEISIILETCRILNAKATAFTAKRKKTMNISYNNKKNNNILQ